MIWACMDTSRADTGSSQMMSEGSQASARAMPIRCLCPPENSWGTRSIIDGSSPTSRNNSSTRSR